MSDADIKDVYAYMMTRTPVKAPARDNALTFPLGFRPLIAGWNLLYLHPGPVADDASHNAEWLRGRYLVEGPGHCAACHTPMNALGAEESGKPFAGGRIEGWDVPPLNALGHRQPPLDGRSVDVLSAYRPGQPARRGRRPDGAGDAPARAGVRKRRARHGGVSAVAGRPAGGRLPAASASQAAAQRPPAPQTAAQTQTADQGDAQRLERGGALFNSTCAACHAASAPMTSIGARPSLAASSAVNADSPRNAINLILQGIPLRGSAASHYMPSFAHTLNDQQVADILAYTRVRIAQQPAWASLDDAVAKVRKENTSK